MSRPRPSNRTAGPAIAPGVFLDRATVPDAPAVDAAIGSAAPRWRSLRAALATAYPPLTEEWSFGGRRYGWSLRLRQRDRPVVYLTPLAGRFRASLALPERTMEAALAASLPADIRTIVAAAPSYPEGRAIRVEVTSDEEAEGILTLARIRMSG